MDQKKIKDTISNVILPILGAGALLTVALVAPNIVQILDINGHAHRFPRDRVKRSLKHLERRNCIRRASKRSEWNYILTEKGEKLLQKKHIAQLTIPKPPSWDRKWRMVIFDIPENFNKARNALRWKLKQLGFHYLNLSVWIYPYECQDEINAIADYYAVGRFVRFLRLEYFDGMEELAHHFRLL
ncbi:MAG: hypothetical protein AB1352_04770 [Patescibacteria group bacterium]